MKKVISSVFLAVFLLTGVMPITNYGQVLANTASDENYGSFVNRNHHAYEKNLQFDPQASNEDQYATYLAYGYNVLQDEYISGSEVNLGKPILDSTALKNSGYIDIMDQTLDNGSTFKGKTFEEFYNNMNASANVKYKGVLYSGKAKADYKVGDSLKQNEVIIKHRETHASKQVYLKYGSDVNLKKLISDDFKNDLAAYKNTPEKIFENYGTHLLVNYYMGGHAEFDFKYNMTDSSEYSSVDASVEALYSCISSGADYHKDSKAKSLVENSVFSFSSVGGDNFTASSVDELIAKYETWVKTIENKPNLCTIGNFNNSLVPIWQLVDDPELAKALEAEFNKEVDVLNATLRSYDYVPKPNQHFISEIMVVTAKKNEDALAKIPAGYSVVKLNPGTIDTTKNPRGNADMNKRADGDFIYIGYQTSSDPLRAIAYLNITYGKDKNAAYDGYKLIDVDLNKGCGSDSAFVYLWYRRANSSDKLLMTDIGSYYGKGESLPNDKWKWVNHDKSNEIADANYHAGGDFVYLATQHASIAK